MNHDPRCIFIDDEDRFRRGVCRELDGYRQRRRQRLQLALGQAVRMSLLERGIRGDVRQDGGWFPRCSPGRIRLVPVLGFTVRIVLPAR